MRPWNASQKLSRIGNGRIVAILFALHADVLSCTIDPEGSTGELRNRLFQKRKVGGEFARSLRTFVPIATEDLRIGFGVQCDFQI
jgi:hypothetical protein